MPNAAVKPRHKSNAEAARATIACTEALIQLDVSEHIRSESDAKAPAAQADKHESKAALRAVISALRVSEEARRRAQAQEAATSMRRSWRLSAERARSRGNRSIGYENHDCFRTFD